MNDETSPFSVLVYQDVCLVHKNCNPNLSDVYTAYRGYPQTQILPPPEANPWTKIFACCG